MNRRNLCYYNLATFNYNLRLLYLSSLLLLLAVISLAIYRLLKRDSHEQRVVLFSDRLTCSHSCGQLR